jgi:hypothetical protein
MGRTRANNYFKRERKAPMKIDQINKILNPWRSTKDNKVYYELKEPVYVNGDYEIYRQYSDSYVYSYKGIAFNNLAGYNKEHLDRVASRRVPTGEYNSQTFLYERALENLEFIKNLNDD